MTAQYIHNLVVLRNKPKTKRNGVYPRGDSWIVVIRFENTQKYFGTFKTEALARAKADQVYKSLEVYNSQENKNP